MSGSSLLSSGGGASRSPKVTSSNRRAQYQLWNDQRKTQTQNQATFPRPSAGRRTVNSNPWAESSSAARDHDRAESAGDKDGNDVTQVLPALCKDLEQPFHASPPGEPRAL